MTVKPDHFHSMGKTGLSESGEELMMKAGAMRKDLTVSYEVNAGAHRWRNKAEEK